MSFRLSLYVTNFQQGNAPTFDSKDIMALRSVAEKDMALIRSKRGQGTGGPGAQGIVKAKYRKRSVSRDFSCSRRFMCIILPFAFSLRFHYGGNLMSFVTFFFLQKKKNTANDSPGKCHSCNIRETPEWRRGPDGARTLCNACGLRACSICAAALLSDPRSSDTDYAKLIRKRDKAMGTDGHSDAPPIDLEMLRASTRLAGDPPGPKPLGMHSSSAGDRLSRCCACRAGRRLVGNAAAASGYFCRLDAEGRGGDSCMTS